MNEIKVLAPAKLNLSLDILSKRNDGYHELSSIMQTIDLFDEITLEKNDNIICTCSDSSLPTDDNNLVVKAAKAFFNFSKIQGGVSIFLKKNIPSGAGMGGGSSDAAAVIRGLNELYDTGYNNDKLCEIGKPVGADVAFCIAGGTALAQGVGEKLKKLKDFMPCYFVVAKPGESVSTPKAYAEFDKLKEVKRPNTRLLLESINNQDLKEFCLSAANVLEPAIKIEDISIIKDTFVKLGGLTSCMTGSGSAVFGVFDDETKAKNCLEEIKKNYKRAWICKPVNKF